MPLKLRMPESWLSVLLVLVVLMRLRRRRVVNNVDETLHRIFFIFSLGAHVGVWDQLTS
eukprot:m.25530 g.25530  ORF g.25530 m.25530 type:complete len:59 (-) comp13192_c0_seq1:168-344(-)